LEVEAAAAAQVSSAPPPATSEQKEGQLYYTQARELREAHTKYPNYGPRHRTLGHASASLEGIESSALGRVDCEEIESGTFAIFSRHEERLKYVRLRLGLELFLVLRRLI
jgi:hypothetical protein